VKEIERSYQIEVDQKQEKSQKLSDQIKQIENKINQSQSSLYGWLNENYPNWEHSIGKVIDEDLVLFNTELNPKRVDQNTTSLFGIELDLNSLNKRIKTVKEYNQEIIDYNRQILEIQDGIKQSNAEKKSKLKKLKIKFGKKVNQLKDVVSENEYIKSQSNEKLKKTKVEVEEWIEKAKQKKNQL
jgi:uncharacterized protein YlxW (UPF0749 family)